MIRFIDLTGQVLLDSDDPHFAFFNTVPDRFCTVGEEQEWNSLGDFLGALNSDPVEKRRGNRYLRLIPEDYFSLVK